MNAVQKSVLLPYDKYQRLIDQRPNVNYVDTRDRIRRPDRGPPGIPARKRLATDTKPKKTRSKEKTLKKWIE